MLFEDVFVPHERVFLDGEHEEGGFLTTSYATHHRHSCIAARAGFGDLLIGAGALMMEANGLDFDRHGHLREPMVELIKIVEGFFACGVASSVYAEHDPAGSVMPDPVFANIGKLLMSTQIYDMHRIAHYVSGGLVVALPGPDEDHNPATAAQLSAVLGGRPDIPAAQRAEVARFIEDLTASHQGGWYSLISLHGGGEPRGDEARNLAQLPGHGKDGVGRTAARSRGAWRAAPHLAPAWPLLHHGLPPAARAETAQSGGVMGVDAIWYFDVISPYAYLQTAHLDRLSERLAITARPVLLAGLLQHWGQTGPAEIAPKRRHVYRQCQWRAGELGIPFRLPDAHPFNPLRALRLLTALDGGVTAARTALHLVFGQGVRPDDDPGWAALAGTFRPHARPGR